MSDCDSTFVWRMLEALRDAFRGAASRHDGCYCRLNIADDNHRDRLAGQNSGDWAHRNLIASRHFKFRERALRPVSSEEHSRIAERHHDAKFVRFPGDDDELWLVEPGVLSTIHCRGDHLALREFDALARDAGFCLIQVLPSRPLSLKLPSLVPYESIAVVNSRQLSTELPPDLSERWIAFLHILGWQNVALSPLRAPRHVWHGHTSFTGDPEQLHELIDSLPPGFKEHWHLPTRFFASTLSSDLNLSSLYAIDVLLAGYVAQPAIDVRVFQTSLEAISSGNERAGDYHRLVAEILSLIFAPELHSPVNEEQIHEGRGRIDIVFTNGADRGYFADLPFRHEIKCPVVFFECKNYSSDVGPAEFAQTLGTVQRQARQGRLSRVQVSIQQEFGAGKVARLLSGPTRAHSCSGRFRLARLASVQGRGEVFCHFGTPSRQVPTYLHGSAQ